MKLLLDTNVLVAALVARGTCSDLLEHCVRQHVVVSSQPLLNELRDVLEKKFSQRLIDVRAALQLFAETFTLVTPESLDPPVCRDHDDDVVLATGLAGECAAIITGDQDLLTLNPFRDIQVLAPSAFWKWEAEQGEAVHRREVLLGEASARNPKTVAGPYGTRPVAASKDQLLIRSHRGPQLPVL